MVVFMEEKEAINFIKNNLDENMLFKLKNDFFDDIIEYLELLELKKLLKRNVQKMILNKKIKIVIAKIEVKRKLLNN